MSFAVQKLKLFQRGSNSELYRYGDHQSAVVIKAVPMACQKEYRHLKNQYSVLKQIQHPNIVSVLKFKENVDFASRKPKTINIPAQPTANCPAMVQKSCQRNQKEHSRTTQIQEPSHQQKTTVVPSSETDLRAILIMEEAEQGNLLSFIKKQPLEADQTRGLFKSICSAVQYLHHHRIAHRDIKLDNILVCIEGDTVVPKIADFGFASLLDGTATFTSCKGTRRGYMSPEIHAAIEQPAPYDPLKADVFALGVVLFALVLKKLPFQFACMQNPIYKNIAEGAHAQFWAVHSRPLHQASLQDGINLEDFQELFLRMVDATPSKRPSINEVLTHPWLLGATAQIEFF